MRFEVHVVPGSPKPGPDGCHGDVPRLRVAAAARDGRANAEVEQRLGELLGLPVRVVGGAKGRRKLVEADGDVRVVRRRLAKAFGRPVV